MTRDSRATCYTIVPPAITTSTTAECYARGVAFSLCVASFKKFHLHVPYVKRKRHRAAVLFRAPEREAAFLGALAGREISILSTRPRKKETPMLSLE